MYNGRNENAICPAIWYNSEGPVCDMLAAGAACTLDLLWYNPSMTESEYRQLCLRVDAKCDADIKQAHDERTRNREALDRVWRMATGTEPPKAGFPAKRDWSDLDASQDVDDAPVPDDEAAAATITSSVKQAVAVAAEPFTYKEIVEAVSGDFPNVRERTVMHVLRGMVESGTLKILLQGSGKRATRFVRPSSRPSFAEALDSMLK